jgi:hypothetical protein
MRSNETDCDPNHKRPTPDRDRKTSDTESSATAYQLPRNDWRAGITDESGGETFVAMMQAADLRDGDHLSDPAWHDRARVRAILVERKMRAGALVVVDVLRHDAAQVVLVKDHDVI